MRKSLLPPLRNTTTHIKIGQCHYVVPVIAQTMSSAIKIHLPACRTQMRISSIERIVITSTYHKNMSFSTN